MCDTSLDLKKPKFSVLNDEMENKVLVSHLVVVGVGVTVFVGHHKYRLM